MSKGAVSRALSFQLASRSDLAHLWNEENRITHLYDQGKETIFRYDDGGTRILKRGKYGEIVYVDPNFSIRGK